MFPEYTLAPEVQFPVQHEQCYDSLKWLTENGKTLGLEGTNFAIAGDSAGGEIITRDTLYLPIFSPLTPSQAI